MEYKNKLLKMSIVTFVLQIFFSGLFCLIPLLFIKKQFNKRDFYLVALFTTVAAFVLKTMAFMTDFNQWYFNIVFLEQLFPVILVLQLVLAEKLISIFKTKVLSILASSILVMLPVYGFYFAFYENINFDLYFSEVLTSIDMISEKVKFLSSPEFKEYFTLENIVSVFRGSFERGFLFFNFLILFFSYAITSKVKNRWLSSFYLMKFSLNDLLVWPFIICSSALLALSYLNLEIVYANIIYNFVYALVFLYFLQGLGIFTYLMFKHPQYSIFFLIGVGLVLLLNIFVPFFGTISILSFAGFGISEIWIKYRKS